MTKISKYGTIKLKKIYKGAIMKRFTFFNIHKRIEIEFDENRSVAELISAVYEKYGIEAKNGIDGVTVYDMKNYHVVTNRKSSLKKENLSSGLCFAYFKKDKFLYVEGGWGHHMIKMDAVSKIREPFMFYMSFIKPLNDYAFVANKKMTVAELYGELVKGEYIHKCSYVDVYHINRGSASYELVKHISIDDAIESKLTILELISEGELSHSTIMFSLKK